MNKNILIAAIICAVATSCTTKKSSEVKPVEPASTPASEKTPVPEEISKELSALFSKHAFDHSIKEQFMSPAGNLILKLNEDSCFSEGATITIYPHKFDDLENVVTLLKTIINIEKGNAAGPVKEIKFDLGPTVKVAHETEDNSIKW